MLIMLLAQLSHFIIGPLFYFFNVCVCICGNVHVCAGTSVCVFVFMKWTKDSLRCHPQEFCLPSRNQSLIGLELTN